MIPYPYGIKPMYDIWQKLRCGGGGGGLGKGVEEGVEEGVGGGGC